MNKLKNALSFGGILSPAEIDEIAGYYTSLHVPEFEHYLNIGKVCNHIAFVDDGIIRAYSIDNKLEEVTKHFSRANQFVVDLESFYSQSPAESGLQAMVDSRLYVIHRDTWSALNEQYPKLYILSKSLAEAALLNKIKDNDFLNYGNAKEKYLEFLKRYPDIANYVPQQYIAQYLKIAPQSLSRIRRSIQQE